MNMVILPSKRKVIRKDEKSEKIKAIFLLIKIPHSMAPTAKGMAKKHASVGKKGNARLMASEMKIPPLTRKI